MFRLTIFCNRRGPSIGISSYFGDVSFVFSVGYNPPINIAITKEIRRRDRDPSMEGDLAFVRPGWPLFFHV